MAWDAPAGVGAAAAAAHTASPADVVVPSAGQSAAEPALAAPPAGGRDAGALCWMNSVALANINP